jgi:hypothetical protein
MEAEQASGKSYSFKNLDDGQDPKEEEFCTNNIGRRLIYVLCYVLYRVSQEECARLREGVPYVKVYRYNPKHLSPKLNFTEIMTREKCGLLWGSTHCTCQLTVVSVSSP